MEGEKKVFPTLIRAVCYKIHKSLSQTTEPDLTAALSVKYEFFYYKPLLATHLQTKCLLCSLMI